ncbi:UDP-galactose transporter Gms1 [Coemansia erecta]|uniref:UDP-galactose transporter Gms1 n=1 Tax=Coemansia erecta TaxID=147472 RepID=A0A9W8CQ99_9FUNG|nr:UDP-galactose transporter Gms1 [Coemansia erecta]
MDAQVFGVPLKYVSLVVLTVQNSLLVLVMRYSRVSTNVQYYASTAVLLSELTKFAVCLALAVRERLQSPTPGQPLLRRLFDDVLGGDSWKMMIPAGLYTIQNNLQYAAVTLLDAATFQVTYQLKILTTALCAVLMLGTQLGRMRWLALVLLTAGVALVQLPSSDGAAARQASSRAPVLGLLTVGLACVLSGLAGVYFEKVLKGSRQSVWLRNVQLSLFSTVPALFGVLFVDGRGVRLDGFFYGYSRWTCAAILCQALGGLIVAVVVKYADNILKGFATSISIVLSCLASVWLFGFRITPPFVVGAALVIYATYLYGAASAASAAKAKLTPLPVATADLEEADSDGDDVAGRRGGQTIGLRSIGSGGIGEGDRRDGPAGPRS